MTKTQIYKAVAEKTGLRQSQIAEVFGITFALAEGCLGSPRACGEFTIPEFAVKIRRVKKKATKARMGRNPATGEEVRIAAKPARQVIKVSALKALKSLV